MASSHNMTKNKEDRGPELEIHSPGIHGGYNSTKVYYKVEYRQTTSMTQVIGNGQVPFPFVIDHYWRTLGIEEGTRQWGVNIPVRDWDRSALMHGLLTYVVAESHRWAFLAALEAGASGAGGALCVETRIVSVKLHEQHSTEEVGVSAPMSLHDKESFEPRKPKFEPASAESPKP